MFWELTLDIFLGLVFGFFDLIVFLALKRVFSKITKNLAFKVEIFKVTDLTENKGVKKNGVKPGRRK